jgi:DNA replication protein DnaC
LLAQLADLDAQEDAVLRRDALQRDRPEGCGCLGVGGTGLLIAVLSDGLPIFEGYCPCDDGERAREAAAWANEAVEQQDADEQRQIEQARRLARSRDMLVRAGIDRRYEVCTFENLRALLAARGYLAHDNELMPDAMLAALELSYGKREPLRGDYIYGAPGHGKTSSALAALRAWIERGRSGRFIREGDFLDALHASMARKDGEGDALLEQLKTTPLLVFDDLAMMVRSAYDRGKVVGLLVARHADNALTILTSNYSRKEAALRLSDGDGMERDRLEGRLREMCDQWQLVTGDLRTGDRDDVQGAIPTQNVLSAAP